MRSLSMSSLSRNGSILLIALLAPRAPAQEARPATEPVPHPLPIVEVTVYEDRALVTREGEVPVQGGKVETVVVGGLPPALSETSLRAGLADPAQGRVISVSSEVERKREIQDTKLRTVEQERRALGRRLGEVDDELARIAAREAYLDAYEKLTQKAVSERTGGGGDPETARWSDALKFVRDGRGQALVARRDAERRKEELARQHQDLEAEAGRLRRPEERSVRRAEVALEARAAGRARLRLSYVIEGAAWSPRYDARFDPERGDLQVTYFGEVKQRTGEDWREARLVLSTARPSVGASRPELLPVKLATAEIPGGAKGKGVEHRLELTGEGEETRTVFASPPGLAIEDRAAAGGAPAAPAATPAEALLASESREGATAATFSVPGTATIPSDERPHKVPVATFRERVDTSFETVPRLERFVYLKASARNGSPHPMLAGPVDIYRGSGFIGTSQLRFVAPGRPFEVSLGIEESLKVRRAVTHEAWDPRRKEKRHGFDIEVANFGERPQTVTAIENYPIADIEEVRVRLEPATTPPAEKNEKDGILRWKLEVPPGDARTVHIEYTITYPRDYKSP